MTADLLRRAAAELRESVKELPPGTWTMRDGWGPAGDGLMRARRIASDEDESSVLVSDGELVGSARVFEHIVTMSSPPVALALADLFDKAADGWAWGTVRIDLGAQLLASARAVLREPEGGDRT